MRMISLVLVITKCNNNVNHQQHHCVKTGPYFNAFGLNTERYSVPLRILSKCGKVRTRKTPNTDTFHVVYDAH